MWYLYSEYFVTLLEYKYWSEYAIVAIYVDSDIMMA